MTEVISSMDVKRVLIMCARAVADKDISTATKLMDALGQMVSVLGTPIERYTTYKKLRYCDRPTGKELFSYVQTLAMICAYYKFAYVSSNVVIQEAMANEGRIHIIDFQMAMGSQWVSLIKSLAKRPGKPPFLHITGVDDENSAYACGRGRSLVGERLYKVARSCMVPFVFNAAAMSGCHVNRDDLSVWPDEAVAVNFPFMLHQIPDDGVSMFKHRYRLLRLVKGLRPKVVTLVEQEFNTNTAPFLPRFLETLDYYTAMFESVDVACPGDAKKRLNYNEQRCLPGPWHSELDSM
ncbi:Belongs to the GRAS [Dionaea muscipula]